MFVIVRSDTFAVGCTVN